MRGIAWDATANAATLDATLKAAAQSRLTETAKGKVLIGSASNGTQVTYSLPPLGDLSAADVSDVVSDILDRVDAIRVATPAATDTQIVNQLLADLQPVRTFRSDFSALSRT